MESAMADDVKETPEQKLAGLIADRDNDPPMPKQGEPLPDWLLDPHHEQRQRIAAREAEIRILRKELGLPQEGQSRGQDYENDPA